MNTTDLHQRLASLASNHRWTWKHSAASLLNALPTAQRGRHPFEAAGALDEEQLAMLAADEDFTAQLELELASLADLQPVHSPAFVYYSPEFGLSELLPQYSGGLGVLAGDHLKAASDLGLPLAAVGLFYREGFFRQDIDGSEQSERYETYRPEQFGCEPTDLTVQVPIGARTVAAAVWRLCIGSIPLLLLDTDVDANEPSDRAITDRLYSGDRRHRLEQELVLGVGGARAVAAMDWTPGVHHLNEGHAGFLLLELIDQEAASGASLPDAVAAIRPRVLFTTHTPVSAGIDRFDANLIGPHIDRWARRWAVPTTELLSLATDPVDDTFNMAVFCLTLSGHANGVSKLHGEVSRQLFATAPGGERIGSVTNGVHARTWVSPILQQRFDTVLGDGWDRGETAAWARVDDVSDAAITADRRAMRQPLVELVTRAGGTLDPRSLVLGFARRFATYKRATLLLRHPELLAALLADDELPVHFVFAGKAHPADLQGKELLADVVRYSHSAAANGRFSFLPDYDMAVARAMYGGCDVWLNTPVRPYEASGTSGEKAALNGGLNCSIRDGWWAEMSDGYNGFDIAESSVEDAAARDDEESARALTVLGEVVAEYHADRNGAPSAAWLQRMRHGWRTLGPMVTAARMVAEYRDRLYEPMLDTQGWRHP